MEQLRSLAALIQQRNAIDREIAVILNRPVHAGHFGEYVAGTIFGITLNPSANAEDHDGHFTGGSLVGQTVNVKYATARDGNLNLGASLDPADHPDFYLVLTGPIVSAGTSRGTTAPWQVHAVYLFRSSSILAALAARGIRPGTATSVRRELWEAAMVYPQANNPQLHLSQEQRNALGLFTAEEPNLIPSDLC